MNLKNRRIVITGAGGIGAAVARDAIAAGARVHLIDVSPAALTALRDDLGTGCSVADLANTEQVERAFQDAADNLDGIDGLVAIAGGSGRRFGDGPADSLTAEAALQTLELNAVPPLLALGAFVRHCDLSSAPRGAVLIGSVLASSPESGFATHAYAVAKAGIEGLTKSAARHYIDRGIAVNTVAPGLTRTPMSQRAQRDDEVRVRMIAKQPLTPDGFVDPEEVAQASLWLLSSGQVTGQVLQVDGGWNVC